MKKTMFILGSIEALLGIVLFYIAEMMKNLMPLLGRIAFQSAMVGGYSPDEYILDILTPVTIALILIIAGLIQIAVSLAKKEDRAR